MADNTAVGKLYFRFRFATTSISIYISLSFFAFSDFDCCLVSSKVIGLNGGTLSSIYAASLIRPIANLAHYDSKLLERSRRCLRAAN